MCKCDMVIKINEVNYFFFILVPLIISNKKFSQTCL